MRYATVGTVAWCIVPFAIGWLTWGDVGWKAPNTIGDFLAGIFAPLAFTWLAVAVVLQSQELKAQRLELRQNGAALRLQATELRRTVEELERQTKEMTAATEIQIQTFKRDSIRSARRRLAEDLVARVRSINVHYKLGKEHSLPATPPSEEGNVCIAHDTIERLESRLQTSSFYQLLEELHKEYCRIIEVLKVIFREPSEVDGDGLSLLHDICGIGIDTIGEYRTQTSDLPRFEERDNLDISYILQALEELYRETREVVAPHIVDM